MMPKTIRAALWLAGVAVLACAGPAMAQPPAPVPLGRLSDAARPTAYRIALTVRPEAARFTGHVEIDVAVARPAAALFLHGSDLAVARVTATIGGRAITGRWTQIDPSGVARIDFATPLPAGRAVLAFDYDAPFKTGGEGLYHAKVGDDWYAWTQMEPIDARRMFPGFDEPGFKVPFTISVTAAAGQKVFANAPETAATPVAGGLVRHDFAATKPLPTYLVAIAVGPFDVVEGVVPANAVRAKPLPYRVIATKGQQARLATAAIEGPKILALHEAYFGIPYPYEKLDQIASPIMSGAMENAGLVAYQDTSLLLSPDAPLSQQRAFGVTVAHELAHQWFGDLVTPTWWTDIWLNESFAEWAGNRVGEAWRPGLGTGPIQLAAALDAMDADSHAAGRPIRQPIERSDQIASAFDAITYKKGGQVLTMFERYMGADKWRRGAQYHLRRFAYGNATAEDFFASIAKGAGDPAIVPAFRSFVEQSGVPVVTIRPADGGWMLAQKRYFPLGVAAQPPQRWSVPVCARQGEVRSCTLLTEASGTLKLTGRGLAIPDADGAGYWRYSLDDAGWAALMAGADKLPAREAMAAADSLWADFAAGNASFDRVLASARILARHPERLAATQLAAHVQTVAHTLLPDAAQPGYRRLMAALYAPTLAGLGLDPRIGAYDAETPERRQLRQTLTGYVAIEARDPAVRATLVAAADAALHGDARALDPAYRIPAFQVAIAERGAAMFDAVRDALIASNDPLFRRQAIQALSTADAPALAPGVLMLSRDPRLQSVEQLVLAFGSTGQPATRDALFAMFKADFTGLVAGVPAFVRPRVPTLFASYCDEGKAAAVDALFSPQLATLGGVELELAQTLETIRLCAALKAARGAEIAAALK